MVVRAGVRVGSAALVCHADDARRREQRYLLRRVRSGRAASAHSQPRWWEEQYGVRSSLHATTEPEFYRLPNRRRRSPPAEGDDPCGGPRWCSGLPSGTREKGPRRMSSPGAFPKPCDGRRAPRHGRPKAVVGGQNRTRSGRPHRLPRLYHQSRCRAVGVAASRIAAGVARSVVGLVACLVFTRSPSSSWMDGGRVGFAPEPRGAVHPRPRSGQRIPSGMAARVIPDRAGRSRLRRRTLSFAGRSATPLGRRRRGAIAGCLSHARHRLWQGSGTPMCRASGRRASSRRVRLAAWSSRASFPAATCFSGGVTSENGRPPTIAHEPSPPPADTF